jgi:hypothetical protein
MSALLEETRDRTSAAYDALRGGPVGPPIAVRRWPWAAAAALVGAAAGAGLVVLLRRLIGQDAPGAQEPEELEAVIDLRTAGTA